MNKTQITPGPQLPRCSDSECDHGETCRCDPQDYIRFLKNENRRLYAESAAAPELVEALAGLLDMGVLPEANPRTRQARNLLSRVKP